MNDGGVSVGEEHERRRADDVYQLLTDWREQLTTRMDRLESELPERVVEVERKRMESGEWVNEDSVIPGLTWGQYFAHKEADHQRYDTYGPLLDRIVTALEGPPRKDLTGKEVGRDSERGLLRQMERHTATLNELDKRLKNGGVPARLKPSERIALYATAITVIGGVVVAFIENVL